MSSKEINFSSYRRKRFNYGLDIAGLPEHEQARFRQKMDVSVDLEPEMLLVASMLTIDDEDEIEEKQESSALASD